MLLSWILRQDAYVSSSVSWKYTCTCDKRRDHENLHWFYMQFLKLIRDVSLIFCKFHPSIKEAKRERFRDTETKILRSIFRLETSLAIRTFISALKWMLNMRIEKNKISQTRTHFDSKKLDKSRNNFQWKIQRIRNQRSSSFKFLLKKSDSKLLFAVVERITLYFWAMNCNFFAILTLILLSGAEREACAERE